MKLIANKLNNSYLINVLPDENVEIDKVLAAIAYGSLSANHEADFIQYCINNKLRLDLWMRYDHTVPVAVPLLERLLASHKNNIFCRLIPDLLHCKVIWWKGYGAYIGSANFTDKAWVDNYEAGIFFDETDLEDSGMGHGLEMFFENLKEVESFPVTQEIISEMKKLTKLRRGAADKGKNKRSIKVASSPHSLNKEKSQDRMETFFQHEWIETLTILRKIGEELTDQRPSWVEEEIPIGWQTDQFLHAYYYNIVRDGNKIPYEEYFIRNKVDPQKNLTEAVEWWANTQSAPSSEDQTFNVTAPYLKVKLSEEYISNLNVDELSQVILCTHATRDHLIKIRLDFFGVNNVSSLSAEDRAPIFAEWLIRQKNTYGDTFLEILKDVLYGGKDDELWERLFRSGKDPRYKIPHYGLNSYAEIVGWVRPDIAPPRNGRTSKALRALGYDVKIY